MPIELILLDLFYVMELDDCALVVCISSEYRNDQAQIKTIVNLRLCLYDNFDVSL